jgi:hypothetical protein
MMSLSVSLREEERFEGPKKSRPLKSPFVYIERNTKKERKEKGRRKKALGGVGIHRFGFFGQKLIKSVSSFSLDASVEEN